MTDKQIKEGIDVSQCECYSVENNSCNHTLSGSCMKEKCQIFRLLQTIKAKEQENEELKHALVNDECFIEGSKKCVKAFCLDEELRKQLNQLKQALTEIKEIAEVSAPMTDEYENCYDRDRCFECDFTEDCQYFNIKQILQKISEVENE